MALIPLIGGLIKSGVGKAVGKAIGRAGAWVGKKIGGAGSKVGTVLKNPVVKTGVEIGATAGAIEIIRRRSEGTAQTIMSKTDLLAAYGVEGDADWQWRAGQYTFENLKQELEKHFGPLPESQGGGGGYSGGMDFGGIPLITGVIEDVCYKAPRGYSIVTDPATGEKVAMLTQAARALGLVKRRTRGGISGAEIKSARKVQRVISALTVNRQPRVKIRKGGKR